MPKRINFLGCSLVSAQCNLGWNEQSSQMKITLVEDKKEKQNFEYPKSGTPKKIEVGSLKFHGIIQRWLKDRSPSGYPIFHVDLVDPREFLAGVQIITGGYSSNTRTVPNLINAYGYLESFYGFGGSLANEAGMPYYIVKEAIELLTSLDPASSFGGKIHYKGHKYTIDLNDLPLPPSYYRIGGPSISLLDLISQVCRDAAHDFFIVLDNDSTIKIKTISRNSPPPLGTINAYIDSKNQVISGSGGEEFRNQPTSVFIVGGQITQLYTTADFHTFWGFDINGDPIIGQGALTNTHIAPLNALEISDILGFTEYACNVAEMRCALGGPDTWQAYIYHQRSNVATILGLQPSYNLKDTSKILAPSDLLKTDKDAADKITKSLYNNNEIIINRVYEFVRRHAQEYLGRKYFVPLTFIYLKIESETGRKIYSHEPTEAAFLPEGSSPLGLASYNEDLLTNQDGRFRAFCRFPDLTNLDQTLLNGNSVWQTNGLYAEMSVEPNIVVYQGTPGVIVTIHDPLVEMSDGGPFGDIGLIAEFFGTDKITVQKVLRTLSGGSTNLTVHPHFKVPDAMAIPILNNISTYGPWYAIGAPGQVIFEQDTSLVPWNYGGFGVMNLAGNAKVSSAISTSQEFESGHLEVPGLPTISMGEALSKGGPEATTIDMRYGKEGMITTYTFENYTKRFGLFARENADRLRRLALAGQDHRRKLREIFRYISFTNKQLATARLTWYGNVVKRFQRTSPHQVLISHVIDDPEGDSDPDGFKKTCVSSISLEQAIPASFADDDSQYKRFITMSLDGLIRPCITNDDNANLPGFVEIDDPFKDSLTKDKINPFKKNNDVDIYTWGDSYKDLHAYRTMDKVDADNTRILGLKGPPIIVGFGYDIQGNPVPTSGNSGTYLNQYLRKSHKWKAGPLDPLWDEDRGTWSVHDLFHGIASGDVPDNGEGYLEVYNASGTTGRTLKIKNFYDTLVPDKTKMICGYFPYANDLRIISANCP